MKSQALAIAFTMTTLTVAQAYGANSCMLYMRDGQKAEATSATREAAPHTEANSEEPAYPKNLRGDANPLLKAVFGGLSESRAFRRAGVALQGIFEPIYAKRKGNIASYKPSNPGIEYGGVRYVEFPNSTAMTTVDPTTGKKREFILTRGVKPYEARINVTTGVISPKNYVSDVLLFERVGEEYKFVHRILASDEAKTFFFEDPRVSVLHLNGEPMYFLSGTDYSPHAAGATDPDVMNRFVKLDIDSRGVPKQVEVDPVSGKPDFMDLSPAPRMVGNKMLYIDAKNATLAQNDEGQLVIRMRLRPDFKHPYIKKLAGGDRWDYAEQVFVFRDWNHFRSYDMNDAIVDLFGKRGEPGVETFSKEPPLLVKTLIRDRDLQEHLKGSDNVRIPDQSEKPKGLGPGTRPLRLELRNGELFASDGPNDQKVSLGRVPVSLADKIRIKEGEVLYVTFDHEIRYAYQKIGSAKFRRRHYSASIKVFDRTLTNMVAYLPDVIQPKTNFERGLNSGILDLLHVYPMGWVTATGPNGRPVVRVYAGASDAHTTVYEFDMINLLSEKRR